MIDIALSNKNHQAIQEMLEDNEVHVALLEFTADTDSPHFEARRLVNYMIIEHRNVKDGE